MESLDHQIVGWIINFLLAIVIAISGYVFKKLFDEVKDIRTTTKTDIEKNETEIKELSTKTDKEIKDVCDKSDEKFVQKELFSLQHEKTEQTLSEMKSSMDSNFRRLYDKVDATNSIGEGLTSLGNSIMELAKKDK